MLEQVLSVDTIVGHIGVEQWLDGGISKVNLKPTNYCTSMWGGYRCSGKHADGWHKAYADGPHLSATWREGGVFLRHTPYEVGADLGSKVTSHQITYADRTIQYAGQLGAIGTWGLAGSIEPLDSDWADWFGSDTDIKRRWEAYRLGRDTGVYSVNEIRAMEDMPPKQEEKENG